MPRDKVTQKSDFISWSPTITGQIDDWCERVLEKRDHIVEEAASGDEALELLKHHGFDVIVMDVQMPEMDGFETSSAIRQHRDDLAVRPYIIALTAHAMEGDRERCLAAGMDAYIAKPLRARQLLAAH